MTLLGDPSSIRERAAKCRALAKGRITGLDSAEWIRLAEQWESLADSIEAHAFRFAMRELPAKLPSIAADPLLSAVSDDAPLS